MVAKTILIFDLDDTLYQKHGVVADDNSGIKKIKLYPEAKRLLEEFKTRFKIILVTKGDAAIQNKKIDLLKIRILFDGIMICSLPEEKKACFLKIKKEFPKEKYIVIGDKLGEEIRYGNELGMITVQLKKGKYENKVPKEKNEIPQYTINEFSALSGLLNAITK